MNSPFVKEFGPKVEFVNILQNTVYNLNSELGFL